MKDGWMKLPEGIYGYERMHDTIASLQGSKSIDFQWIRAMTFQNMTIKIPDVG